MAITRDNLKLLASEVMADTDTGGGQMTGVVILDNKENNIFPDISELDRTYGRVRLRKLFAAVLATDDETFFGSHLVVDRRPADPLVDVLLFSTGSWSDRRANSRDAIERYLSAGPLGPWWVYDTQTVGESALQLFSRPETPVPDVGDVLLLVEDEGLPGEYSQYVRVTAVTSEVRTFTDDRGEFQRQIISCELSDPLRSSFHGAPISRLDTMTPDARVRETRVADAARYYGCRPLVSSAGQGGMQVQVDSIWGQLVPAARSESPVLDVLAGGIAGTPRQFGSRSVTLTEPAYTDMIPISLNNRALNYVVSLNPIPALGTTRVWYRALGKWYALADDGTGSLTGAGSGTLRPDTGSLSVTLQALPDVGSWVIFSWGVGTELYDRSADTPSGPYLRLSLAETPEAGSVSVSWTCGGVSKTATDSAAGDLSGHGTGQVYYGRREIHLFPGANLPDAGTQITVTYQHGPALTHHYTDPARSMNGHVLVALPEVPVEPRSVFMDWNVDAELYDLVESVTTTDLSPRRVDPHILAQDDGAGNLVTPDGTSVGTVNYSTGVVDFLPDLTASYPQPQYAWQSLSETLEGNLLIERSRWQLTGMVYLPTALIAPPDFDLDVTYRSGGSTSSASETFPASLTLDLLPTRFESLVPGAVSFTLGATHYADDAEGRVLRGSTQAGTVDYHRARITLTDWLGGSPTLSIQVLGAFRGRRTTSHVVGRTPGSPVQPGGFILSATARSGALLSATGALDGQLTGLGVKGQVLYEEGLFMANFGHQVLDSGLSPAEKAEPWYRPQDVDAQGFIWRPIEVFPETIRFNAVVYSYLPLSADILGLDPVRLPSDGRVPIFRKGGVAWLHHSAAIAIAAPTPGQVVDCGRVRLADVELRDAADVRVDEAHFSANLNAGTVILGNLSSYLAPITLTHRVADLLLIGDVQIDGTLTFTRSLTHDYPADEALLSSALIGGDLWAHLSALFEQATWTGVWADSRIGDAPVAQYNAVQYQLELTDDGTITERWFVQFLNTTQVRLVGETVGQIYQGPITDDIAPLNPATGTPYLTLRKEGWGGGWATGNLLRFNTLGAGIPLWLIQSIQQGPGSEQLMQFRIQLRGDINA